MVVSVGCAPARSADGAARSALPKADLTDYVPAAGLRWLAVARLAELAHAKEMRSSIELLFPATRLDAFAGATGVELRESTVAVAAGFDVATLFLAETPWENIGVERKFIERMTAPPRIDVSPRGARRITGTIGSMPETLIRADRRFVAVAVGDPTLGRIVQLYAEGRLGRSPAALRGSALSTLPAELATAPMRFYAPGPFSGEWASGARGLLGVTLALGVAAFPEGDDLRVVAALSGRWNGTDVAQLEAAWSDLSESSMGRLLGLNQPATPAEIAVSDDLLTLRVRLQRLPLVTGLRAAVVADVWEFLKAPNSQKTTPAASPAPP